VGRVYADGGAPFRNRRAVLAARAAGVDRVDELEHVRLDELLEPAGDTTRWIVLRVPAADHAQIRLAAASTGTSVQEWLLGSSEKRSTSRPEAASRAPRGAPRTPRIRRPY
jgi:predicted HicB family RNase H-like nuclease